MSKKDDIFNRVKRSNTGASAFINTDKTEDISSFEQSPGDISQMAKVIEDKTSNRKTKEDFYKRQTYLIENETIDRFNRLANGKGKGFKTEIVNFLLKKMLDELEVK